MSVLNELRLYLGLPVSRSSFKDMLCASLAALLAILCVLYFSQLVLNYLDSRLHLTFFNAYVVTSIAATAVLVFAVPHGALSQPWAVIGGHLLSAFVGVLCFKVIDNQLLACATAVSLAILLMSFFRCIHPPGGATALGAVLGGEAIHDLGFSYLLVPTLLNCTIVLITAMLINYPFAWRRYPAHLYFKKHRAVKISPGDRKNEITTEDFLKAINEHGSYIDITDEGWADIFENAKRHAELDTEHPSQLEANHAYSNGRLGKQWQIRRISTIDKHNIEFAVLTGLQSGLLAKCSYDDFLAWAKFEVTLDNNVWVRCHQDN